MKNFMDENFLLQTETAQKLYHEHAAKMPIIDYHCHLIPQMVADDYQFKSLTEIWLGGDHYKWRAMRTNGVVILMLFTCLRMPVSVSPNLNF